jgi:undecaprenyl-diphosphatase
VVVFPVGALLAALAARRSRHLAWVIVATVAARPAVEWLLKEIVSRPRPTGARLVDGTGFSFPSGHVLAAAATWAFLPAVVALYTRRRSLWWAAVAVSGSLVGLMAWCRVWLGVHWTSDVVASLALSFLAFSAIEAWLVSRSVFAGQERCLPAQTERRGSAVGGEGLVADDREELELVVALGAGDGGVDEQHL